MRNKKKSRIKENKTVGVGLDQTWVFPSPKNKKKEKVWIIDMRAQDK